MEKFRLPYEGGIRKFYFWGSATTPGNLGQWAKRYSEYLFLLFIAVTVVPKITFCLQTFNHIHFRFEIFLEELLRMSIVRYKGLSDNY